MKEPTDYWIREAETLFQTDVERQAYVQGRRAGWVAQDRAQDVAIHLVESNRALLDQLRGEEPPPPQGVPCVMANKDGSLEVKHLPGDLPHQRHLQVMERPDTAISIGEFGELEWPTAEEKSYERREVRGLSGARKVLIVFEEI